jgi:hypothetical protein
MNVVLSVAAWAAILSVAATASSRAEDLQTYQLTLKAHKFTPTEIHVPSGKPFFVAVTNLDDTAEEFDMPRPAVEKIIPPSSQGKVRIRPLAPGRFPFTGEQHEETAKGVFVSE